MTGRKTLVAGIVAGLLALAPALPAQAANANLKRCQQADADFDYEKVITYCALAATDPSNTREQQVTINRLLAIAHTALNDEKSAEEWFIRLVIIDPEHAFGPEQSPIYHQALEKAKQTVKKQGAITVKAKPNAAGESPSAFKVTFEVTDRLNRIDAARVRIKSVQGENAGPALEVPLSRSGDDGKGHFTFTGEIPYPPPLVADGTKYYAEYALVLLNAGGTEMVAEPPFEAQRIELSSGDGATVGTPSEGFGVVPWVIAGVGVGTVVLTTGVGVITAVVCLSDARACTPQPPQGPAGYVRVSPAVE